MNHFFVVWIGRLLWGGVDQHGTSHISRCGVPSWFTRRPILIFFKGAYPWLNVATPRTNSDVKGKDEVASNKAAFALARKYTANKISPGPSGSQASSDQHHHYEG